MKIGKWIMIVFLVLTALGAGVILYCIRKNNNIDDTKQTPTESVEVLPKEDNHENESEPGTELETEFETVGTIVVESPDENLKQIEYGVVIDDDSENLYYESDSISETSEEIQTAESSNSSSSSGGSALRIPNADLADAPDLGEIVKQNVHQYSDVENLSIEEFEALEGTFSSLSDFNDWLTELIENENNQKKEKSVDHADVVIE